MIVILTLLCSLAFFHFCGKAVKKKPAALYGICILLSLVSIFYPREGGLPFLDFFFQKIMQRGVLAFYLSYAGTGTSEALFRKKDHLSPSGGNGDFRLPDYLGAQLGVWQKILRCCIFRTGTYQLNGASCGYRVLPHDPFVDSADDYLLSDRSSENAGKDLEEGTKLVLSFLPAFVSAHLLYLSGGADSGKGRVFLHPDALQFPFRILRILTDSAV